MQRIQTHPLLARRHELPPLKEPPYEMEDVPRAQSKSIQSLLSTSMCERVEERTRWTSCLGEMVLLTNRANKEFEIEQKSKNQIVIHPGKPLGLEYMADRMDTDDPLFGWMLRSKPEGWLQGYCNVTTFTTWQKWFRWDSLAEEAGVIPYDPFDEKDKTASWWDERLVDGDGSLARALGAQMFDGDPDDEGVIWPHIAEISLLGGLGCGGLLLDAALEEISKPKSQGGKHSYEYVVVQATENAVPFYESRGFIRVGAVARYEERPPTVGPPPAPPATVLLPPTPAADVKPPIVRFPRLPIDENSTTPVGGKLTPELEASIRVGVTSAFDLYTTVPSDSIPKIADKTGTSTADLVFMNRRFIPGLHQRASLIPGTKLRIPHTQSKPPSPTPPLIIKAKEARCMTQNDAMVGEPSSNKMWYNAQRRDTPRRVAKALNVDADELVNINLSRYPGLTVASIMLDGTTLVVPGRQLNLNTIHKAKGVARERQEEIKAFARDLQSTSNVAIRAAVVENKPNVPPRVLTPLVAYRHWTFADEAVELNSPSYMMAMSLHRPIDKGALGMLESILLPDKTMPPAPWDYRVRLPHVVPQPPPPPSPSKSPVINGHVDPITTTPDEKTEDITSTLTSQESIPIRISLVGQPLMQSRQGPLPTDNGVKVFLLGSSRSRTIEASISRPLKPQAPRRPVKPMSAFLEFCRDRRVEMHTSKLPLPTNVSAHMADLWNTANATIKAKYNAISEDNVKRYNSEMEIYNAQHALFKQQHPDLVPKSRPSTRALDRSLFNKVLRLDPKPNTADRARWLQSIGRPPAAVAAAEDNNKKYRYYFTLTFVPDLNWCRLAPLIPQGVFTDVKRKSKERHLGRTRWMCAPEAEEIDVSASRCVVVRASTVREVEEVDREEWDITEDGEQQQPSFTNNCTVVDMDKSS